MTPAVFVGRGLQATRAWLLLLCTLLLRGTPAHADEPVVQVRLRTLHPPATVRLWSGSGGRLRIGAEDALWRTGTAVRVTAVAGGVEVTVGDALPRRVDALTARALHLRLDDVRLGGAVTLRSPDGRTLYVVAAIPLEDYVAGVTAAEALPGTPPEALRAQAVAARSYAVALARLDRRRAQPMGPHADEGFDLCDLTHCQVFRGLGRAEAAEAARSTRGQCLWRDGRVVAAWYHSTCGGHTVDGRDIGADPALRGGVDAPTGGRAWCAASPHFRWSADISRDEMRHALESDSRIVPVGRLRGVRVVSREEDGRAREVEIASDTVRVCSGQELWQMLGAALGWGRVESAWFTIKPTPRGFHFDGRGCGHGAGLCQYGSIGMARAGHTCAQILAHYYKGTKVR